MKIEKGMILVFGDELTAEVVRADPDGSCALWFSEGTVVDYAPGVIQDGIAAGEITIEEN